MFEIDDWFDSSDAGGVDLPFWSDDFNFNPWDSSHSSVFGDPDGGGTWAQQQTPFSCAVVSQMMILDQFGIEVSEAQLIYDATSNGWLTDGGTSMEDMDQLLNSYGIPTHEGIGGGIEGLAQELAQGHKVIVGVDSGEMWGTDDVFSDWLDAGAGADHAIVVNGIDASDPNNVQVYVNDPGDPSGAGKAYPMDQFLDAWNDSGQYYVSTSEAPGSLASHNVFGSNFDPESGWYFNPEFWGDMLEGIGNAVASADFVEAVTGEEGFGTVTAMTVGFFEGFSAVIDHMPSAGIDDLFYQV